jgi:hypothetical protein
MKYSVAGLPKKQISVLKSLGVQMSPRNFIWLAALHLQSIFRIVSLSTWIGSLLMPFQMG